jgi:hypothetical protein
MHDSVVALAAQLLPEARRANDSEGSLSIQAANFVHDRRRSEWARQPGSGLPFTAQSRWHSSAAKLQSFRNVNTTIALFFSFRPGPRPRRGSPARICRSAPESRRRPSGSWPVPPTFRGRCAGTRRRQSLPREGTSSLRLPLPSSPHCRTSRRRLVYAPAAAAAARAHCCPRPRFHANQIYSRRCCSRCCCCFCRLLRPTPCDTPALDGARFGRKRMVDSG